MKRRGSLLFELSIAAGLVAVAMIAVVQLLAVSAHQDRALDQRQIAAQEAANALERVMILPWDEVTSDRLAELLLPSDALMRLPDGQIHCEVKAVGESPQTKEVSAEVSWRNRAGRRDQLRLSAWKFQLEPRP